jgi:uncharacterized protein (TIGR02646 family)
VKYIDKTNEPEVLAKFKAQANDDWQPSYDDFRGKDKREFHSHLIAEQGHICCYCGERIQETDSHIEHFKPQKHHPDLELDYFNLLTSCQNKVPPKEPRHCGMGKGDWFDNDLLVSPLIIDCSDFFEYTLDGQILPTHQIDKTQAATETIDRLSLNISKLRAARTGSIASFYDDPDFLSQLSVDEIDRLIDGFDRIDENGRYLAYCQAMVYVLKQEQKYRKI